MWERSPENDARLEVDRAFWKEHLGRDPIPLELATDEARPAVERFEGLRETLSLPPEVCAGLERLAAAKGSSLATVVLAGLQALLHRHTESDSVVLGLVVGGRDQAGTEPLVGLFMNELALRTDVAPDETFSTLLARATQATRDALAHQGLPLDEQIRIARPGRQIDLSPLFRVAYNFKPRLQATVDFGGGLVGADVDLDPGVALIDLILNAVQVDEGLAVHFDYDRDLFRPTTVKRLALHLRALLEGAIADPDRPVARLPLMSAPERETVLRGVAGAVAGGGGAGRGGADPGAGGSAPGARGGGGAGREADVRRARGGEQPAGAEAPLAGRGPGIAGGRGRSARGARAVRAAGDAQGGRGLRPGRPRSPGGTGARDPGGRRPGGADRAVGLAAARRHAAGDARSLALDDLAAATAGLDGSPLDEAFDPEQLAYILFTSGSTGRPKGVEVLRGGFANFLRSMAREPGLREDDRFLAITTTTFDISGLELFGPLWVGATTAIVDRQTSMDPRLLGDLLATGGFTVLQATPATWRMLVDAGWKGTPGLRMFCGGEALSRDLADRLLERGGELWNLYGPTETTVWSTLDRILPDGARITIGRPVDRTRVYVLDPSLSLVPPGVVGEIFIGGDGVARGYRGRPDLTAERFLPDPFGPPGSRFYRTGDLGRLLEDGRFECLGRTDHQVKVRGFRIELGEIEAALRTVPGVREVVVVAERRAEGDPRLVAYWTGDVERLALYERARSALAPYMVPSAYARLDAFPLTTSGKIDRKALPSPDDVASDDVPALVLRPRDDTEARIASIWADVLGLDAVGVDQDFFALGGTSLLAIQARSRIEQEFGLEVPLRAFFESPTVSSIASGARLQRRAGRTVRGRPEQRPGDRPGGAGGRRAVPRPRAGPGARRSPHGSTEPDVAGPAALPARPLPQPGPHPLDHRRPRHRAVPARLGGYRGQAGLPPDRREPARGQPAPGGGLSPDLPLVDLNPERLQAWVAEHGTRSFTSDGVRWEAALLRLDREHHVFFLATDHILVDALSLRVAVADLDLLYQGKAPPPPRSFAEYLDFEAHYRASAGAELDRAYWERKVALGAPPLRPYGLRRTDPSVAAEVRWTDADPVRGGRLLELTRSEAFRSVNGPLSRMVVFATALAAFLHRITGNREVVLGAPVANRNPRFASTSGLLMEQVFLRILVEEEDTFETLARRVHSELLESLRHGQACVSDRGMEYVTLNLLPPLPTSFGELAVEMHARRRRVARRAPGRHRRSPRYLATPDRGLGIERPDPGRLRLPQGDVSPRGPGARPRPFPPDPGHDVGGSRHVDRVGGASGRGRTRRRCSRRRRGRGRRRRRRTWWSGSGSRRVGGRSTWRWRRRTGS